MRSVEVQMQDGSTLVVHGLKTDKMGLFMRAMPSLKAFSGTLSGESLMTDAEMAPVFAMLAEMAGITEQQFRELDLFDGLAVLVAEVYHRTFATRRHLASFLGLSPSPYSSGDVERDQGISKAGNRRVRQLMVEQAWRWLHWQPESELTRWFRERFGVGGARLRRVGVVALARKLLVAFWKYVAFDIVPAGAMLKPA